MTKDMAPSSMPALQHLSSPDTAAQIRRVVLEKLHVSGGGHFGGCGSCVELLLALCGSRPMAFGASRGDRLLLSKGHASMTLYAIMSILGPSQLPLDEFAKYGSTLQGHPDRLRLPMLDFSSGSLGQGIAAGMGMALGLRDNGEHVWVVVGDGECQEGMIWESAMLATRYRMSRLHVIVDANGEQECGWSHDPALDQRPIPDDLAKWKAFGWHTSERDGHDVSAISQWIEEVVDTNTSAPSVLIARTRKSLAAVDLSSRFRRHHAALTSAEYKQMSENLKHDPSRAPRRKCL